MTQTPTPPDNPKIDQLRKQLQRIQLDILEYGTDDFRWRHIGSIKPAPTLEELKRQKYETEDALDEALKSNPPF